MTVVDQLSFSKNALNQYAQKIGNLIDSEVANEESFYADFRDLLKDFFKTDEFEIIVVPKSEETADKPDFIVYMDNIPIIHIEGKNPYDPIDKWLLADTTNRLFDQVYRFRGRENNNIQVIITDFIHIWVIDKDSPNSKDSDHQVKLKIKLIDDSHSTWKVFSGIKQKFESILNFVCEDIVLSISKVSSMIPLLVKYAKMLRDKIIGIFKEKSNPMKIYLESIRNDFLDSIFSSDKEKKSQEFADLVAQTLVYGGFIAWMRFCKEGNDPEEFSFNTCSRYLPYGTFTFNLFIDISTKSTPEIQDQIISKIERVFQSTQFEKIIEDMETLMITFYTDFLWKYDPEIAKDRGIVFTPHPIINFIVRGIDYFLKLYFNIQEGLISPSVKYLDPAAGTMGFPCEIIRTVRKCFEVKYEMQPGRIISEFDNWVKNCFLKNIYAFEILMAPYVLGHLRTNMLLDELGRKTNSSNDRVKLFLFNTLMKLQTKISDFRNPAIGQEIVEALNVRNSKNILVVLSNPPYNVSSQNKFDWIEKMINYKIDFFTEIEKKELARNPNNEEELILTFRKRKNDYFWDLQREGTKDISGYKAIQDDYVKFIRFAQWKIKKNGYGIVGFITNNYYLDGLIFRGMRSSLMRDFDEIWVVDLHGDARKGIPDSIKEVGIDLDENVFDIRVGVAIVFFIRKENHSEEECSIKYIDKWGSKFEKFEFLQKSIQDLNFKNIPKRVDYEFCPDEFVLREKYSKFNYLVDIFKKNIVGVASGHAQEVLGMSKKETRENIRKLFNKYLDMDPNSLNQPNKLWNPKNILKTSLDSALDKIFEYIWNGFDRVYICYDNYLIGRDRYELMQYLIPPNNNISLIVNRKSRGTKGDSSVFIADTIFRDNCLEGASGLSSYSFPLLINDSEEPDDRDRLKPAIHSNIKQKFKEKLKYKDKVTDKQIFFYIYGVLNTPIYRKRYYLGLKEDFPRIPFPEMLDLFLDMMKLGKRLAELHLLKAGDLDDVHFEMGLSTDYKVHYIRKNDKDENGNQIPDTFDPKTNKIYFKKRKKSQIQAEKDGDQLDDITWIGGITQEMWDFEIGGRQQLKEWLYARIYSEEIKKNTIQRPLNTNELKYFLNMCDAIKKTIELLPELDEAYRKIDP